MWADLANDGVCIVSVFGIVFFYGFPHIVNSSLLSDNVLGCLLWIGNIQLSKHFQRRPIVSLFGECMFLVVVCVWYWAMR